MGNKAVFIKERKEKMELPLPETFSFTVWVTALTMYALQLDASYIPRKQFGLLSYTNHVT